MSVLNQLTQQVRDANGNLYTLAPIQSPPAANAPAAVKQASAIGQLASATADYVAARAQEQTTQIGALAAPVVAQPIMASATNAVVAGLAGDYLGAVTNGVPALLGIIGGLAAILLPEKSSGSLTDAQIQNVVSSLTRQQLISLLDGSANAGATSPATGAGASAGGSAGPVPTAGAAVHTGAA